MQKINNQAEWIERAKAVLPAGGFGNFDPSIFIREGQGSRVWDEDGKEYVDFLIGSGPMMLGHGHPEVMEAVFEQLPKGMTFFANNTAAVELAEAICDAVACADQVRYVATGSEADMYAIRLARAFTGRSKILKFEGGYHGMSPEAQMSLAPEKRANFPTAVPDSAGIPDGVAAEMLIAPFNDPAFAQSIIDEHGADIAGIIVEPLQRLVPPAPGFLETLRALCDKAGILLIFDEIVTGFRLAYGGAQEAYGVTPDLCTLGKVIGGGFALAAVVGRADIMRHFDKNEVGAENWLMQLGTLSGTPVAAVAGLKTMEILRRDGSYDQLEAHGRRLMSIQQSALNDAGIAHQVVGEPALFDIVFSADPVRDYREHQKENLARNSVYNKTLREHGILKAPSKLYVSLALTEDDFSQMEQAVEAGTAKLTA